MVALLHCGSVSIVGLALKRTEYVLKEGEGELDVGAQRLGFDFELIT
jgi:hypothetical protein